MRSNKELAGSVIKWIDEHDYETYSISIGRDRNSDSLAITEEISENWRETKTWVRSEGGFIIRQVDWPDAAASWLSQGRALNRDRPDAIVIVGSLSSCRFVLRRLLDQHNWSAYRTFCLFTDHATVRADDADLKLYEGLKCLTTNGERWTVLNGLIKPVG